MNTDKNRKKQTKESTNYDALKKVLSGDASSVPCSKTATGCAHHK